MKVFIVFEYVECSKTVSIKQVISGFKGENPWFPSPVSFSAQKIFLCLYSNIPSDFLALFSLYVITIIYR